MGTNQNIHTGNTAPWGASRTGSLAAISGAVILLIGTIMHPGGAEPNMPVDAFTEYAASQTWVASHLLQLLGVILVVAVLVLLARSMADGPAAEWATLGLTGAGAILALSGALQAVDGVALKVMVDSWASRPEPEKTAIFQAALGVRQIEIGLASITSLIMGLTVVLYGIALLIDWRFPRWIGAIALAGGAPMAVAGVVIAYTGFSDLAMIFNMAAGLLLIVWMVGLGVYGWRQATVSKRVGVPLNRGLPQPKSEL